MDKEFDALDPTLKAKYFLVAEALEAHGPHRVHGAKVKHLEGKLCEMRLIGRHGISRAIYLSVEDCRIVVVHIFAKKTQKTPRSALKLASQRAK